MKQVTYSSLGLDATLNVPDSVEEFELNAAGKGATSPQLGACLESANANVVYRGALQDFRSTMLKAVELVSGVTREKVATGAKTTQTVVTKGVDGNPDTTAEVETDKMKYKLSEAKYFGQVLAQLDEEPEYFQSLADLVIKGVGTRDDKGVLTLSDEGKAGLNSLAETYSIADTAVLQKLGEIIGEGVIFDASEVEREAPVPKKTGKAFLEAADSLINGKQAEATAAKLAKLLGVEVLPTRESLGKAIQLWDAKKRAEEKKQLAAKVAAIEV